MHTSMTKIASKHKFFQNLGFRDAARTSGDIVGFRMKLESVYARMLDKESRNELRNEQRREEFRIKSDVRQKEIQTLQDQAERVTNEQLPDAYAAIEEVKMEIADINENPEKYAEKQNDRFRLWLFGTITVIIGLFLVFFYGSVIYSAFFRQISIEEASRLSSVIYQHAHRDAWHDGIFTFMMIILGPVIFLGIGLVAHYMKFKNRFGKWIVFGVTFLFDGLLAYHLARKLFEAKEMNSFQAIPDYGIPQAIMDANFWLVIGFGFVTYVFFSFVLELFDRERDIHTKIKRLLESKKEELAGKEERKAELQSQIDSLMERASAKKLELAQMELELTKVKFSPGELRHKLSEYAIGWIGFIMQRNEQTTIVPEIEESLEQFLINKGL